MDNIVEETINELRRREVRLVLAGNEIVVSGGIGDEERQFLAEHRDEAIAYLLGHPESAAQPTIAAEPPADLEAVRRVSYAEGRESLYREVTEALQRIDVRGAEPPSLRNPIDEAEACCRRTEEMFSAPNATWNTHQRAALAAALETGDRAEPVYAHSCRIIRADGRVEIFQRPK